MNKRRDPEQDLDRLLDEDGGEFAAIYRRLAQAEPPRRLDRAVLANAARAVHGDRAPRGQRWLLGFGSAAGIVLAAGIAWQVGKQIDSQEAQSDADRSQRSVIPVEPISESTRLRKSTVPMEDAVIAEKEADVSADSAQLKQEAPRMAKRKPTPQAPAPKPAPLPPPPAPAAAPMLEQRAAEEEMAPAMSTADEAQPFPEKKDLATGGRDAESTGALRRERSDKAAGNAATMSAPKASAEQSRAPSPNSSVKLRQNMHLAPQDWLAEIVRLKREGRRQEAIENLRLFRRMHPDWKLSDELLRLAQ